MGQTNVDLYFIDTSTFPSPSTSSSKVTSNHSDLPLLSTLPLEIQSSVLRFLRPPDRQMSLASALLKFYYIHRTARVPWNEITISRTPDPHRRPFWNPSTAPSTQLKEDQTVLEFNVSHQAGLVGLAGAVLPPGSVPPLTVPTEHGHSLTASSTVTPNPLPTSQTTSSLPSLRLGIDITCTTESSRGPNVTTPAGLDEWISIFADVFSEADVTHMTHGPLSLGPAATIQEILKAKLRRFYTFFALKEAYVKMTGEALLAGWLREVEFRDVVVPEEGADEKDWGNIERGTNVWFNGQRVERVKVVTRGWGKGFIVSIMVDGEGLVGENEQQWRFLDWRQLEQCATGICECIPGV